MKRTQVTAFVAAAPGFVGRVLLLSLPFAVTLTLERGPVGTADVPVPPHSLSSEGEDVRATRAWRLLGRYVGFDLWRNSSR